MEELINNFSWKARTPARQNLSLRKCGKVVDLTYFKMSFFEGKKKPIRVSFLMLKGCVCTAAAC